jgi:GTP-binding protein EngB required for normal cell division
MTHGQPKLKAGELRERTAADAEGASLSRIAELAEEFGAREIADAARSAAERVTEGRYYVACVGQFKRGKSTLLNALMDRPVLATGVPPVTAVPTVIRYGKNPAARVRSQNGGWTKIPLNAVEEYVSGEKNPENRKSVAAVEIFVPLALLAAGMCLVDTPGVGSVFSGNTAATREFVPQIDAAIVVIGADPPISHDELELVEAVAREASELIFVLNKADRSSAAEREAAIGFAKGVLRERLGKAEVVIFETSALEHLERRGSGRDWPRLLEALNRLVETSGRLLAREAGERAMRNATRRLLTVLEEERGALERPLAESERRIAVLREAMEEAEQALADLGVLLSSVQQRLSAELGSRRNAFMRKAMSETRKEFDERLAAVPARRNGARYRRDVMRLAQEVVESRLRPWLEEEARVAESAYGASVRRFVELSNDYVRRFAESSGLESGRITQTLDLEQGLQSEARFRFNMIETVAAPASPLLFVADLAAGVTGLRGGIVRDAREFLARLIEVNSARVQSDVEERVAESRRKLEREIKSALRGAIEMAEQALARARAANEAGGPSVAAALERIANAEREVFSLC